ncbi:uncharacterized protein LOC125021563 isoform X2 [Mugil cephalus]|uniref:uncharacterized protein LOC125021563 isoform X2 n=1 Tax=Mugil cephalus TaxID=48193 RepID=UPI001FB59F6E|nr:uncharacterized protein LOC125021563 isoform X2 [Mugil cephalus]
MTSAKLVLCLTWLLFGQMAKIVSPVCQENTFKSIKSGENLTLPCPYESRAAARIHWYKQTLGQKPRLISTIDVNGTNPVNYNEFEKDPRFTVDTRNDTYPLIVTNVTISDSATYYCATSATRDALVLTFEKGTVVAVWQGGLNSSVQPTPDTTQLKCSVTVSCGGNAGLCDGEHSVYWFEVSGGYHPRVIYSHTGRNDQCERKNSTKAYTCVYTLPMKSLNLPHNGTYYCAVASYGCMVFGDRIELDIEDSDSRISPPSTTNAEGEQNEEDVHYAALRHHNIKRSRRQRNDVETECVYSSIKQ